jgi:hypothetical protein
LVASKPQGFGSSFYSSQFVNPNGEVITNSQYIDSNGNHAVDGVFQNIPLGFAPSGSSVELLNRPGWDSTSHKVNSKVSDDSKAPNFT